MKLVFTRDEVFLREVDEVVAKRAFASRMVRKYCKRTGSIYLRYTLAELREMTTGAGLSGGSFHTSYRTLFQSGLQCWSQKMLREDGTLARWPGEKTPTCPYVQNGRGAA